MRFQVPENLAQFSINGLQDLIKTANTEFAALKETLTPDTVTDEQLEDLETLHQFVHVDGPGEIAARKDRADRFSSAVAEPEPPPEPEPTPTPEPESTPTVVTAGMTAQVTVPSVIVPRISDIVGGSPEPQIPERRAFGALVAAAGVPGYNTGQPLADHMDIARAFEAVSAGHGAMSKRGVQGEISSQVAIFRRDYPDEFSIDGDEHDYPKLLKVADETRLPGGNLLSSVDIRMKELQATQPNREALVAAAGWCAPSETDYDICLQITTDGLLDAPEVQARRGGVRHNTGIEFDSIFGSGAGFFDLTEAQVAAGTPTKTCLEIPCPSFVDDRLGVTGLCLTGNILSIRGYPEFTAAFTRGAMAASAHQINREQIIDMVAGSTAVGLGAAQPWLSDNSFVSQVLSAVEFAIVDIKYRLRLQRSATLEVVMPYWVLSQMRADWVRRNAAGDNAIALTDSMISAAFAARGARVQYVYDWQDAFATGAATGMGGDTIPTSTPVALQFLVYPAGTWVRAVSDVITLNSVYDSTKLATNQVTHLFTETGWFMLKMCPVSRVYTVNVCANGKTGLQRDVLCV